MKLLKQLWQSIMGSVDREKELNRQWAIQPEVNQVWVANDPDPFKRDSVLILDIKDGYVKYRELRYRYAQITDSKSIREFKNRFKPNV